MPQDKIAERASIGGKDSAGVLSVKTDAPLTPSGAMTAGTPRAVFFFATRGFWACGKNGGPVPPRSPRQRAPAVPNLADSEPVD